MAGFNANGIPGGTEVALVRITFTARTDVLGTAVIELKVNSLADTSGNNIGIPAALGGSIEIVNDPSITPAPEITPTIAPTLAPTVGPTQAPTLPPTAAPTQAPTFEPTVEPTPLPGAGRLSFYPDTVSVNQGERTVVELHVNCGDQNLGAFGIKGDYPANLVTIVSIESLVSNTYYVDNLDNPGSFAFAGFESSTNGIPGSTDLALARITIEGSFTEIGMGIINITSITLSDPQLSTIGVPAAGTCTVTVNPGPTGEVTVAPTAEPAAVPTPAPTFIMPGA
jgi:hypothetical protein